MCPVDIFGSLPLVYFVACVARSIEISGWVGRKQAYRQRIRSTVDMAAWTAGSRPMDYYLIEKWAKGQPTKVNFKEAQAALKWVKGLKGDSEYERNLKIACSFPHVKVKNQGLVASILVTHRRFREREIARQLREHRGQSPEKYFGLIGRRYVRKLTVSNTYSWNSRFGITVLYLMEDGDGNRFKWYSSGGCQHPYDHRRLDSGDSFYFTFSVKDHDEYKGHKETVIARATPSIKAPIRRWTHPITGEVYKTMKAMKIEATA